MSDEILSTIYLLLLIVLIIPGFYYANKNKKIFFKNLLIWIGVVGITIVLVNFLQN